MIKIINEGHKERAFCATCKKVGTVTFKYKSYLTEVGDIIPGVLQGFCDKCNERLLLPPQSIPKIKPYYMRQSKTQEYKVANVIEDALLNIGAQVRMEKPDMFRTMLRFYLATPKSRNWIRHVEVKSLGLATARLSFRIDMPTDLLLTQEAHRLDLTKSQFISMMIWDAKDRLLNDSKESRLFMSEIKLFRAPDLVAV
jgi:hypothetical protein